MKRLLEFLTRPRTIGIAVGIAIAIFFVLIQGPARCNDGWPSPSIGKQGACSHHGGVASSLLPFELALSAVLGWAAAALRNRPLERRRLAEQKEGQERFDAEAKGTSSGRRHRVPSLRLPDADATHLPWLKAR